MVVLSEPLVPALDFMAMEKNKVVGEKWGTCEAHSESIALKINIKIIFFHCKS